MSERMMLLYLDPGETTGWASWDGAFRSGQLGFLETGEMLEKITWEQQEHLRIGWEKFMITPRTALMKGSAWALEIIGVAHYFAVKYNATIIPCYPSSSLPADPIRDKQLKRIGWHTAGRIHANDAAHHLMRYMLSVRQLPPEDVRKLLDYDHDSSGVAR